MTASIEISDVCFEEKVPVGSQMSLFVTRAQRYHGSRYAWNGDRAAWEEAWNQGEREGALTTLPLLLMFYLRHRDAVRPGTYVSSSVELCGFAPRKTPYAEEGEPVVVTIHPAGTTFYNATGIRRRLERRAANGLGDVDRQVLDQALRGRTMHNERLITFSYDEYVVETGEVSGRRIQGKPHAVVRPFGLATQTQAYEQPPDRFRGDSTLNAWFTPRGTKELLDHLKRDFYRARYSLAIDYRLPTPGTVTYHNLRFGSFREGIVCGEDGFMMKNGAFLSFPPAAHNALTHIN